MGAKKFFFLNNEQSPINGHHFCVEPLTYKFFETRNGNLEHEFREDKLTKYRE